MSTGTDSTMQTASNPQQRCKVFVSSTYRDNVERRKVVQDAIAMAGMIWHGMEIFTASPRPTVEECLRYAREADIFVGIIAHRYGWIPDGSEKSITEMEYDAARDAGKDRLMFVLDPALAVYPERDYDEGPDKFDKQKQLAAFRERFSRDQMPAQFNETTLMAKVLKALQDWRERPEPSPIQDSASREAPVFQPGDHEFEKEIQAYLLKAEALYATLPMAGFATHLKVPIDIGEIYVPLHAMLNLRGVDEACFHDASHAEEFLTRCNAAAEISLPEAFRQLKQRHRRGIVILGDPGAGKTTHLKRLLLWCLREGAESIQLPAGMLPVFLPLRDLRDVEGGFDAFFREQLRNPHLKARPDFGERLLKRGNLLVLLDGLDEIAEASRRERVSRWIEEASHSYPNCCFVVTSRFAGYVPKVHLGAEFLEMHIRPLSEDQVERFVQNWYRIVERELAKDPEQADGIAREKADRLIERLKEPHFRARRVFALTRNPLLLTNICLVHRHRGELPRKRARLYEECIGVLLEHWQVAKGLKVGVDADEGCRALQPAALWLHGRDGRTRARAGELAPHIEPVLKAVGWNKGGAEDFLRTIRDESGLLTGWDAEHYGFMHLGFQEYLAAREIRSRSFEDPRVLRDLASHFGESWWQEVTLLFLALKDPSLFAPFMREVLRLPAASESREMVELCLDEAAEVSAEPFVELLEQATRRSAGSRWDRWLPPAIQKLIGAARPEEDPELWQRQLMALSVLERLDAAALERLLPGFVNHPSADIRRWVRDRKLQALQDVMSPEPSGYELVRIPGGAFMMGSPKSEEQEYKWERPIHKVEVADFYVGRYPVTNEQYGRFLAEYPGAAEPEYWANRQYNQPRQPVLGVSWDEARRYAEWAGLRLPSEAEWEYACRAGTNTRFYTGDTEDDLSRAGWYGANSGGQLHSVGEKEPNSLGLYDMHGNVWEWIEDDWHESYKGAPANDTPWIDNPRGSYRVLRGGCWGLDAAYCRSAGRCSFPPGGRSRVVGFRLSRSVALGS
jgi:formylglycine-generating enzyme required for sulfatase activity